MKGAAEQHRGRVRTAQRAGSDKSWEIATNFAYMLSGRQRYSRLSESNFSHHRNFYISLVNAFLVPIDARRQELLNERRCTSGRQFLMEIRAAAFCLARPLFRP